MSPVRLALSALSAIAALITLGAWALPDSYYAEDQIVIAASPDAVYAELANLRAWAEWHGLFAPGAPGVAQTYSGPDHGPGASLSWRAADGGGAATLLTARPPGFLGYEITVEDGAWRAETRGEFHLSGQGEGTEVRLTESGAVRGIPLLERYQTALTQTLINRTLGYNLTALKRRIESRRDAEPRPSPRSLSSTIGAENFAPR